MASVQSDQNADVDPHELTLRLIKDLEMMQNTVDTLLSSSIPQTSSEAVQHTLQEHLQEHIENSKKGTPLPVVLSDDPIKKLTNDLSSNISQLEELILYLKAEQTDLQDQQRREEEKKQELTNIKNSLDTQMNEPTDPEPTAGSNQAVKQWEMKLNEAQGLCKTQTQQMFKFISEHFPAPTEEEIQSHNKKHGTTIHQNESKTLLSMSDIMEQLMNACLETPNDAYISIDNSADYWPPYIELLVRFGIALRHPDNQHQIRLTPYHH